MIDIGKFSKPHISGKGVIRFGITKEETAAQLREFADRVEKGEILIQKVQTGQVAGLDDYLMQALFIEFAEQEKVEGEDREVPERIIERPEV